MLLGRGHYVALAAAFNTSKVFDRVWQPGPTHLLICINDPQNVICNVLSMLMIPPFTQHVIGFLIHGSNLNWFLNVNMIYRIWWIEVESSLLIISI